MDENVFSELKDTIIVALDVDTAKEAEVLIKTLHPYVGWFKIGLKLITAGEAWETIKIIRAYGKRVFYDGKFHDIPYTVGGLVEPLVKNKIEMFDVHCVGGPEMVKEIVKRNKVAVAKTIWEDFRRPAILGVIRLSSLDATSSELAVLALSAKQNGLDGVVASGKEEIKVIRNCCGKDFIITAVGIRPDWAISNGRGGHKRPMTPKEASQAGANYLVIGRPLTHPPKEIGGPAEAAQRIIAEIYVPF